MGLGTVDLWPVFQIPKVVEPKQSDFFLDLQLLPRQQITGVLRVRGHHDSVGGATSRCKIIEKELVADRRNTMIKRIQRSGTTTSGQDACSPSLALCVKMPKKPLQSLCAEALVQHICSRALIDAGVKGAIPVVYDIYCFADETRFSMDYIEGTNAIETVLNSPSPDTTWLQILAQTALLLGYLEEQVHLDHRDLKADNLWIRPTPICYTLKVGGILWQISAPFQVVLLDFGFSCLGDEEGNATVSLSDGVLPLIDPCPKEGRDLFQLIASMWAVPQVRARIGPDVAADIELLLKNRAASYIDMVRNIKQTSWIYWAVSDKLFRHPPLHPVCLLERLAHEWYPTAGVTILGRPASAPRL